MTLRNILFFNHTHNGDVLFSYPLIIQFKNLNKDLNVQYTIKHAHSLFSNTNIEIID